MLSHPPATDALALLHAELGAPPLATLDASAGPRALRAAVATAAGQPDGGLLALLVADASAAALPRTWLATGHKARVELHTVPVADGVLLLVRVAGTGRRPEPPQPRSARRALSTRDTAPVPGATAADLDDAIVRRLLRSGLEGTQSVRTTGTNDDRYLARFGLLAHDGAHFRPTVAALLIAGHRPALHLPGCRVEGVVDGEPLALHSNVVSLVRAVDRERPGGVDAALLAEVVLNALLHRDWRDPSLVRLEIDGERLEVGAPGRNRSGSDARPKHRNPLLVRFAAALDLAHGEGRGLRDVARRLARQRRPAYSLVEREGEVVFVAEVDRPRRAAAQRPPSTPRHLPPVAEAQVAPASWPPYPPAAPPAHAPPGYPPAFLVPAPGWPSPWAMPAPAPPPVPEPPRPTVAVPALLPREPEDRAEALLTVLRARGGATTRELASALGCSRPVVGKALSLLVEAGRVRREVTSSRSPFQRYVAVD